MPRNNYLKIAAGALAVLALILILAVSLGRRDGADPAAVEDAGPGVQYLRSLEAADPEDVVNELKILRIQQLEQLRTQRLRQLEDGEISVWSLFEDYVLLGDSRAVGFYYYDYLPEERVLAEGGSTIRELREHIPDIQRLDPSMVFLCYGLNDVSIGYWDTPEEYVAEYAQVVRELQQAVPDLKVYISSTLPARDPAFDTESSWRNIPAFNDAVEVMCDGLQDCWYVDNDQIAEEYADLWDSDGVHVGKQFYPHWAANLITEVYSSGLSWDDEAEDDSVILNQYNAGD